MFKKKDFVGILRFFKKERKINKDKNLLFLIIFFQEYMLFRVETDEKSIIYKKMQSLVDTPNMISITRDSWRHIQMLWQQMELYVGFPTVF